MSDPLNPQQSPPRKGADFRGMFTPIGKGTLEYDLYSLENLFQSLADFWQERSPQCSRDSNPDQPCRAISGMSGSAMFGPKMEAGGRLCNRALDALRERSGSGMSLLAQETVTENLKRLRNLLIALHDLWEVCGYPGSSRSEREQAHRTLSNLLGTEREDSAPQLIDASLSAGLTLATSAIDILQQD